MVNIRQLSWKLINQVCFHGGYSNLLLKENAKHLTLPEKNLLYTLTLGTINKQIFLSAVAKKYIDIKKTPNEIQSIFWLALYQMHFLDHQPDYAIVNSAVDLAKQVNPKFAGLVNKVLRKILSEGQQAFIVTFKNPEATYCVNHAFPVALYRQIVKDYNEKIAIRVVEWSETFPEMDLRVNTLKLTTTEFLNKYGHEFEAHKVPELNDGIVVHRVVVNDPIYQEGLVTIQDKASILVGQLLNPTPNSKVVDMCSAPGSKLTHLAALMQNQGQLEAVELQPNRIGLIEQNLHRMGITIAQVHNLDARQIEGPQAFDYLLLDAPCSGFGVMRRKPEIKLNVKPEDLDSLVQLQGELLDQAYELLKVNGSMVYSTCTVNYAENAGQIERFLAKYPTMKVIEERQLFGDEMNSDAFYMCKLQKLQKPEK